MGKFDQFKIISADYKKVAGQRIAVDFLIPSILPAGLHPVTVRFHGGSYHFEVFTYSSLPHVSSRRLIGTPRVSGSSLYEPWYPQWLLELAIAKKAIIVSPNYRLLPESSGLDILKDLNDLWKWMQFGLQLELSYLSTGLRADLDRIITEGDSAGGYLSIQFAMDRHDKIRACIAEFPSLDLEAAHFASTDNKTLPGSPSFVDQHLALVGNVNKASSDMTLAQFPLINAMIQEGRFLDFFGNAPRLFPLKRLETGPKLPPLFIIHSVDDTTVPVEGSRTFVKKLLEKDPAAKVIFTVQPGEHGVSIPLGMKHPWLAEGLELITGTWEVGTE